MFRNPAGLGFSLHSAIRYDAIQRKVEHCSKRQLGPRFELLLLLMVLLAGTSGASVRALQKPKNAPGRGWQRRLDAREFFLPDGGRPFESNMGTLVACLLAAAAFGSARAVMINSPKGRGPQAKRRPLPYVRTPFSSFWRAHEDERKHLSRELHDSVGQTLTAVGLQLRALRSNSLPPDQLRAGLDETCRLNAEALRLVRDLAMGLRPALLDDVSLIAALEWQARQFSRHTGVPASLEAAGDLDDLPEAQRTCIYRCVQEALNNCAKHAQAKSVRVVVCVSDEWMSVTIEDDGIGFDHEHIPHTGLGLLGMRERVTEVNGKLSIASGQRGGTAVTLEIPVRKGVLA
jgi:signal transduction histidine kinase